MNAFLLAFLFAGLLYSHTHPPKITWHQVEAGGLTYQVPVELNARGGMLKRLRPLSWRQRFKRDEGCGVTEHHIGIGASFRRRVPIMRYRIDGTGDVTSPEEARRYFQYWSRATVIWERTLKDGSTMVVADGRFGSAPCIDVQYWAMIFHHDGNASEIRVQMDERRDDIMKPFFESVEVVE